MKNRPLDRTAMATGISKTTIKRIYQTMTEDKEILTPTKWYIKSRITINPDSFDKEAIQRTVHSFYEQRNYPTLTAVFRSVKEKGIFDGGRFCLWKIFREMGFRYKKGTTNNTCMNNAT